MVWGVVFSILAGILISFQGIFNARASEKIGFWFTNTFVHGSGFLLALIILIIVEQVDFVKIKNVNPLYLIGGFLGVAIIYSVTKGITDLGATYAVTILIVTQIIVNAVINYFGFFGEEIILFSGYKILGLLLMLSGLILYQLA
ncbi:DMT family transporter [Thermohalobacter berrensis]|uniref:EamA-like transporter family protein n=1 Tax=Thermohalobacter berrensis TaxID=99594 RepID=A0A419SZ17_9FIRM|nr:DMT family transporter [Thermohalobacter berrensis]RKD30512.1 hypothetical protein BET03_04020 [Thermohalobacter berrensis]